MIKFRSLLFSTLAIVGLSCCNSQQKEHFVINDNDTIASMIERSDSLVKIDIHKYDFKDKELNKEIIDFFDIEKHTNIFIKDSYQRDGFTGRHSMNKNGYKLFLTEKLDTIAYLAFNNYSVGTYVKTFSKIEDKSIQQQIMNVFDLKECDFYVNEGYRISDMDIYSSVNLRYNNELNVKVDSNETQNNFAEQFEEEIYEDDSIVIPTSTYSGLKNLSCTLDYFQYILRSVLCEDFEKEEDALYRSIALRDIGEFAIRCTISSDENVRAKASEIISYLSEYQDFIIESNRFKLYLYYFNNMKYYDLSEVKKTENKINSQGDMLYSLYLHSNKFTNEDYCRRIFDSRDNIIGYAGFNNVYFVGPNDFYNFRVYAAKDLKPNKIGWPDDYENHKSKDIKDIIKNIERFYNPF